jgi:hypothetical protein
MIGEEAECISQFPAIAPGSDIAVNAICHGDVKGKRRSAGNKLLNGVVTGPKEPKKRSMHDFSRFSPEAERKSWRKSGVGEKVPAGWQAIRCRWSCRRISVSSGPLQRVAPAVPANEANKTKVSRATAVIFWTVFFLEPINTALQTNFRLGTNK